MAAKARAKKSPGAAKAPSDSGMTHGETLVSRASEQVTHAPYDEHPGNEVHRKGYSLGQNVRSLAHIYTPGGDLRVNGSGILAIAAWSQRLESEGKQAEHGDAKNSGPYTRGLTHR